MSRIKHRRRNDAVIPWLRALAFAAVCFAALRTLGFFPVAVDGGLALLTGVLGLFAPGVGVLVFLVAAGIPLLAGDVIAGAVFLALGFSAITWLSESHGRAFLVVGLMFLAAIGHAEWAVVALAGLLLGPSEGAIAAFVGVLAIQTAGLLTGDAAIGSLATGGSPGTALVDLGALSRTPDALSFGWLAPALARIDLARAIASVTGLRDIALFAAQPFIAAAAAALAGVLRRGEDDPKRRPFAFIAAAAGVTVGAAATAAASVLLAGPVTLVTHALTLGASLAVALAVAATSEFLFTTYRVEEPTAADDADVDELLRMIASAEEELASKHTVERTVLITDMKSFSRLTQELGSAETAKLVQRHRDLLLPVVEKHGGHGKSTGGDGLLAAFETPASALSAAAEMQQVLADYNARRSGEEAVQIRAGAALGEVVLDRGGKPFLGDALNLAARVMSLADGGQVFTSRTVLERAGGTPAFGAVSHGSFRLKNIATPVEVVEILWRADQTARAPHPEPEEQ